MSDNTSPPAKTEPAKPAAAKKLTPAQQLKSFAIGGIAGGIATTCVSFQYFLFPWSYHIFYYTDSTIRFPESTYIATFCCQSW